MNVLGINAYHGDVSAVLVRDGELVAAVEEERFRRIKHVAGFPAHAMLLIGVTSFFREPARGWSAEVRRGALLGAVSGQDVPEDR